MSMSNASETALLNLLFNNTDWANVGDAAGLQNSATAGSFYVALHTADPGDAGNQTTSEASYTGYARVAGREPQQVGDMGIAAYFTDSEGNLMGIWQTLGPS